MKRRGFSLLLATSALAMAIACTSEPGSPGSTADKKAAAPAAARVTPAMLQRGREIYKANCVACHGESGKGDGPGAGVLNPPPRDHTDRAYAGDVPAG